MIIAPLLCWTVAWPVFILGIMAIVIPVILITNTVFRSIGLPFVFLHSAFNNEPETIKEYLKKWQTAYSDAIALSESVPIAKNYELIFAWCENPKNKGGTGWIVTANITLILLVASILSEAIRITVIVLVVAFVALLIWGNS